jgi:probable HAF family extracellular repeat protein
MVRVKRSVHPAETIQLKTVRTIFVRLRTLCRSAAMSTRLHITVLRQILYAKFVVQDTASEPRLLPRHSYLDVNETSQIGEWRPVRADIRSTSFELKKSSRRLHSSKAKSSYVSSLIIGLARCHPFSGLTWQRTMGIRPYALVTNNKIVGRFNRVSTRGTSMRSVRKKFVGIHRIGCWTTCLLLFAAGYCQLASAERADIQALGTLPGGSVSEAVSINERGQIVGSSINAKHYPHAALFEHHEVKDLGVLPQGDRSAAAYSINNRGQAVGYSFNSKGYPHAVLFENGTVTDLGLLPGGDNSAANAINDRGQVVGWSFNSVRASQAFLFENGMMTNLGTLPGGYYSSATAINNRGQVVGWATAANNNQHAFLFDNGLMTDLGTLPGGNSSVAYGINNRGQVVGSATTANGNLHAFLYENGVMTDLGTLPTGTSSTAYAINDRGQIVGSAAVANGFQHAFLFEHRRMVDLGTLAGDTQSLARDINNRGEIVGQSAAATSLWRGVVWPEDDEYRCSPLDKPHR